MIHEDALDLIQYFEGCFNKAYACPAHVSRGGKWPHLTVGYGHTGPDVYEGQVISTQQARDLLARDMANVEAHVRKTVTVKLRDYQFGAVCSLAMNIGPGAFSASDTLKEMNASNWGQFDYLAATSTPLGSEVTGMAREWAEFRNGQGVGALKGLVLRRASELELFFTGKWTPPVEQQLSRATTGKRTGDMLRPGARSTMILDLHEALAHVGFPVTCGDAYTWVTSEAVRSFQEQQGLLPDGIYGPKTARKLEEVLNGGDA